jgi:hypothetical protein
MMGCVGKDSRLILQTVDSMEDENERLEKMYSLNSREYGK